MAADGRVSRIRGRVVFSVALALLVWSAGARAAHAERSVSAEAVVQFDRSVTPSEQRAAVQEAGGVVIRDLHVIRALGVRLPGGGGVPGWPAYTASGR